MELRLGSILIESAMKIGSLADTVDVLVIVDTPAGRLFSGGGRLVNSFLSSTLIPDSNDVQLYVDPDVIPTGNNPRLFPEQPRVPSSYFAPALFDNTFPTMKRPSGDTSKSFYTKKRKTASIDRRLNDDCLPVGPNHINLGSEDLVTDDQMLLSQRQDNAMESTKKPSSILLD